MRKTVLCVLWFSSTVWGFASKDVPDWVSEVSTRKVPAYSGKVPAVELLHDQRVTFDASGTSTLVERRAIKILTQQGKDEAVVGVHYWKNRRDIKDLHAWLVAPNGFQKAFEKSDIADYGSFNDAELYTDGRYRVIRAPNPEVGSVFAYEYTLQEKSVAAQDEFYFQRDLPSLQTRYTATLPSGWTAKGVVFNQAPVQPIVDGSSYTWEMKDLPHRDAEDESASTVPRLAVSFLPPPGVGSGSPAFASWGDVSKWQFALAQGQDEVTPEISAKANQLIAGAKTDYEKLCAIGHFVQKLRYVAIEMDLQNGGGYVPHSADTVLAKQYGDCKDKANLMRCMLKAAGVPSYLVAIYSGDRTHVREQWPSPFQFNHMILAAKVSDNVTAPTAMSSPFGRLLIFDPTDDKTPVGDLPWYLQGSHALVLANDKGDLVTMPTTKPETNLHEVEVTATLEADGKLNASVLDAMSGQPASRERHRHADSKPEDYKSSYQRFVNERAKGAVISKISPEDNFAQNKFNLRFDFDSRDYGQLMQNRMLVFSPAVVEIPRFVVPALPKSEKRAGPVLLRPGVYRKVVRLKIPAGFTFDEPPVPAQYDSPFAKFSIAFRQEPGMLTMTEEIRTEGATLPPDQFETVKKFFDNCRGADRQKAVLVKN